MKKYLLLLTISIFFFACNNGEPDDVAVTCITANYTLSDTTSQALISIALRDTLIAIGWDTNKLAVIDHKKLTSCADDHLSQISTLSKMNLGPWAISALIIKGWDTTKAMTIINNGYTGPR